jgi:hypothetical protein
MRVFNYSCFFAAFLLCSRIVCSYTHKTVKQNNYKNMKFMGGMMGRVPGWCDSRMNVCMYMYVQHTPLPFGKFEYVVCWLWREMGALPLTLRALLYPTIHWRTGDYRLDWGGEVQRATSRLKQQPTTTTAIVDTNVDEKTMLFDESTTAATTTKTSLCVATNIIQTTTPLTVS